jgi:hypothetical protein
MKLWFTASVHVVGFRQGANNLGILRQEKQSQAGLTILTTRSKMSCFAGSIPGFSRERMPFETNTIDFKNEAYEPV